MARAHFAKVILIATLASTWTYRILLLFLKYQLTKSTRYDNITTLYNIHMELTSGKSYRQRTSYYVETIKPIFYNGREDLPDKQVLKLSDAFIDRICQKVSDLECRATVLNINYGHNEQTLKACKRLNDYSIFISKVNEGLDKNLSLKNAISEAISYCIENDILYDILVKQKSEVMSMILTEYNEKLHMKTVRNEGYDDGYDKGYGNGYDSGYDEGAKSRQQEVDALNTEVNALNSEVASMKLVTQSKDSEIEQLKKQIEEFYTFKLD